MTVNIQLTNNKIYIEPNNSLPHARRITLDTTHWMIAKIQNFIACIFCCLNLDTALKIKIGKDEAYVSRSSLATYFHLTKEETIEEEQLKELACNYFKGSQPPTQTAPTLQEPSTTKLSDPIAQRAARLADDFLAHDDVIAYKSGNPRHSGYHVHISLDTAEKSRIVIRPQGTKNQPIVPPLLKRVTLDPSNKVIPTSPDGVITTPNKPCPCCSYGFEHTRNTMTPDLTKRLTEKIKPFDMFAIFSMSNNLLIIPDTQKTGIDAAAFPHLFALNKEQLCKVFSAVFAMHSALEKEFPSYQPNIVAHVGKDGSQTEGLLHMRFAKLHVDIQKLSPFYHLSFADRLYT